MSPTQVFIRLKFRLVVNGVRRMTRTTWSRIGFFLSLAAAVVAAGLGFAMAVGLRSFWDASAQHRILVIVTTGIVVGWWFGPVLSGGVDETIDPARLSLIPLTRSQIRRGQIAAGFIGITPMMVTVWVLGIVVGTARSIEVVPWLVVNGVVVLLAALVGSRALSTTLARMSRSRRGGDLAALIAVLGGSVLFAGAQLIRFLEPAQFDAAANVLRWTPPGMAGEAFELASRGHVVAAMWRTGVLAVVVLVAGWWWSRQLDRLLTEPSNTGSASRAEAGGHPLTIFAGPVRRRLPHTPAGAAAAREVVYLTRSPGRRAALLGGTVLGLVYVVTFAVFVGDRPIGVLIAPVSILFALQYASNQLGVDPGPFWLEVSSGAPDGARWVGRQLLGVLAVLLPVLVAGVILAVWTGGWLELGVVLAVASGAALAMVGVGSIVSPILVTPVPDSGNPFGGRQAMSGTGCSAAIVGMLYLLLVVVLIGPAEVALRWAVRSGSVPAAIGVLALSWGVNLALWRVSTKYAASRLPQRELAVLDRLDSRLNV